jgi:hypothetical protein
MELRLLWTGEVLWVRSCRGIGRICIFGVDVVNIKRNDCLGSRVRKHNAVSLFHS